MDEYRHATGLEQSINATSRGTAWLCPQDPLLIHPELQPLYFVAASAAYLAHTADVRAALCSNIAIANSSSAAVACSISGRCVAGASAEAGTVRQQVAALRLDEVAGIVDSLLDNFWQGSYCALLHQHLDSIGGGLLTIRQLERIMHETLGLLHTWAATPDGAYCGGQVDKGHAAAGRAAFSASAALSDSDSHTAGMLVALSNLLQRTGVEAESEAALRRALSAARAAGDAFRELNAVASFAAAICAKDGWRYDEVAALVQAMQRCLQECRPWMPGPSWRAYEQVRARSWAASWAAVNQVCH